MKQILYLFMLALVCMGIWMGIMQGGDPFYSHQRNPYLEFPILLIPLLLIGWLVWLNGKEKFWKRLITYFSFSVIYTVILLSSVFIASLLLGNLPNLSEPVDSLIRFGSLMLLFAVITTAYNFVLANYEKRVLSKINLWALFLGTFAIPVICELWFLILPTHYNGEGYILPSSRNGSFFFAFLLYEGIYFLWLKGKIRINNRLKYFLYSANKESTGD